ncbi:class I SAM-dependent methyltransferase [Kamptonema formosum]|uniref:class I SAM-dependent methyltransferase n=1 Tax=Kamptonema formosum TaxID=331992 RepID=UPI00036074BA|nr:class I SAM-dependent methyltransferase [Oscillatoria sp. PCC 10802]
MQELLLVESNPVLCDIICQRIAESPHRRITFAEYMDLALYHRQQGYYATNQVNIGVRGDFFTSPHLGADFGELLAEQFVEMWEVLGRPAPFQLVEMGAGQGLLAADVLRYLHRHYFDFFNVLEYIIVERAPALIAEQRQILARLSSAGGNIRWCAWEEIPADSVTGCLFSNELVDALPVHQIAIEDGQLREVYVTVAAGNSCSPDEEPGTPTASSHAGRGGERECLFAEVMGEVSTPAIAEYFKLVGIEFAGAAYEDGYRTEVNLAALEWLGAVASRLRRGYVLTVDYGYSAERYYSPRRRGGTLQCYYRHSHHNDPYICVGRQDITAHVDFTALQRHGELCGLEPVGFTKQELFLMALGLGERIAAVTAAQPQNLGELLRRRDALHQLVNPMGLGGFGVLLQCKGLSQDERGRALKGLCVPVM